MDFTQDEIKLLLALFDAVNVPGKMIEVAASAKAKLTGGISPPPNDPSWGTKPSTDAV